MYLSDVLVVVKGSDVSRGGLHMIDTSLERA